MQTRGTSTRNWSRSAHCFTTFPPNRASSAPATALRSLAGDTGTDSAKSGKYGKGGPAASPVSQCNRMTPSIPPGSAASRARCFTV